MEQLLTRSGFFLSWLGLFSHVPPPPADLFNIAIVRPEFNPNVVSFASVTCKILLN